MAQHWLETLNRRVPPDAPPLSNQVAVVAYVWLMIVPLVTSLGARIALAHSIDEVSVWFLW